MTKYLIVFIDSFPFERLHVTRFISSLPSQTRLIPGLGYSVNLLPELFLGLYPDEIGFYGEWTCDPASSPFKFKRVGTILEHIARSHYYVDRFLHKALGRLMHLHLAQIPFDMLPYFSHGGRSIYQPPLVEKAIFSSHRSPIKVIRAETLPCRGMGQRDRAAIEEAYNFLDSDLFISLVDLDGFGHKYGVASDEHDRYIREIDIGIAALWSAFCQTHKKDECVLFVLSDHGMSNVNRGVRLDLSATFGQPSPDTYLFFPDSTILRVWVRSPAMKTDIANYLVERKEGRLLTPTERAFFGVTASYTGDLLYVLKEGAVFLPSFHGLRIPKGMHGYHPEVPLQHALLACSNRLSVPDIMRSCEVFGLLQKEIGV